MVLHKTMKNHYALIFVKMDKFFYFIVFFSLSLCLYATDGDKFFSESEEGVNLRFKVISEQERTAMVVGLVQTDEQNILPASLTIPGFADEYAVIAVGEKAFMETSFESIIISEGVERIEEYAFGDCEHVKLIKLPSTIKQLCDYSFLCPNLEKVFVMVNHPNDSYCHVFDFPVLIGAKSVNDYDGDSMLGPFWLYGVYDRAVLYVPYGSKEEYLPARPWAYFQKIRELSPKGGMTGDLNDDEEVDISDVVAIINVIAGTEVNEKADVNGDGKSDIADVVAVINIIASTI